jgi:hypothetical protein
MTWPYVAAWIWSLGMAFILGHDIGGGMASGWQEGALVPLWPVALPALRFLHWWQWAKCGIDGPLCRYTGTPWWSRGEPDRTAPVMLGGQEVGRMTGEVNGRKVDHWEVR